MGRVLGCRWGCDRRELLARYPGARLIRQEGDITVYSLSQNLSQPDSPGGLPIRAEFIFRLGGLLAVDLTVDPAAEPAVGHPRGAPTRDTRFLAMDARIGACFAAALVPDDAGHATGELGATRVTIDRLDRRIRLEAIEL